MRRTRSEKNSSNAKSVLWRTKFALIILDDFLVLTINSCLKWCFCRSVQKSKGAIPAQNLQQSSDHFKFSFFPRTIIGTIYHWLRLPPWLNSIGSSPPSCGISFGILNCAGWDSSICFSFLFFSLLSIWHIRDKVYFLSFLLLLFMIFLLVHRNKMVNSDRIK